MVKRFVHLKKNATMIVVVHAFCTMVKREGSKIARGEAQ